MFGWFVGTIQRKVIEQCSFGIGADELYLDLHLSTISNQNGLSQGPRSNLSLEPVDSVASFGCEKSKSHELSTCILGDVGTGEQHSGSRVPS